MVEMNPGVISVVIPKPRYMNLNEADDEFAVL